MKKFQKIYKALGYAALCASLLVVPTSCEDRLESEFYNPDERTEGELQYFFTKALEAGHLFRLEYGPTYHQINGLAAPLMGLGIHGRYAYSSRAGSTQESTWGAWSITEIASTKGSIFNRTNVKYTVNIQGMQLLYNDMDAAQQEYYKPYMLCAKIVKFYAFQRSTDLYDDIPYSEAGGAFQENFFPKYDSQEEIYKSILTELGEVATELGNYKFAYSEDEDVFKSADILNHGSLDKWIRFANSLRLRMAMRIVNVEPALSKSIITELVNNNKMVTESDYNITFQELTTDVAQVKNEMFYRGIEEMAYMLVPSKYVLEGILNADATEKYDQDPRLYAITQPNRYGMYVGNSATVDDDAYLRRYFTEDKFDDEWFAKIKDSIAYNYSLSNEGSGWSSLALTSQYNRATFLNYNMQYPVMLAHEVNLLLAEAAVRWGLGDAASYLQKSIETSARFYYALNDNPYNESTTPDLRWVRESARVKLDEAHLAAYKVKAAADFNALAFKDKIWYIFRQKALCNNVLLPYETYNEARRITKEIGRLPLDPPRNVTWLERMGYPDSESTNNAESFAAVAHKNNYATPVWWSGRTEPMLNHNASPGVDLTPPK